MGMSLGRRSPDAVKQLELLQQQERAAAGETALTTEGVLRLLRDDVHSALISSRLDTGGLDAVVAAAGDDDKLVDERVASLLATWHLDDPTQWSRFESPSIRWGIAEICAHVEKVFAKHKWELTEFPVVGTLTTGQVSAVTQKGNTGTPLILIDNGFFRFAGIMAQLAIFAPYDFKVHGQFSDATLQLIADLAATHTVLNTCLYLFKRATPPQFARRVERFQRAISTFVIAHEFGHIFAGDLNAHPAMKPSNEGTRRAKEFDADKFGFIAAIESSEEGADAVFGPFLYFAGLSLLDRATAAYEGRLEVPATSHPDDYPAPNERSKNLLDWIGTMRFPAHFAAAVQDAVDSCNAIGAAWNETLPAFWDAREALAAYSPNAGGPVMLPEARAFSLLSTLWQYVQARRGMAEGS